MALLDSAKALTFFETALWDSIKALTVFETSFTMNLVGHIHLSFKA